VVRGRFWRRFANRGSRGLSAGQLDECRQRIDFVLGEVDLSEVVERRWQKIPELSQEERASVLSVPCVRVLLPFRRRVLADTHHPCPGCQRVLAVPILPACGRVGDPGLFINELP
jgi:hypothetical protein